MRGIAIWVIIRGLGSFFAPVYAQTVTVTPTAVSVHLGTFFQFSDKVTGSHVRLLSAGRLRCRRARPARRGPSARAGAILRRRRFRVLVR